VGVEDLGRLLTAAEVAQRLGYSERYVWRLGREGVLPRIKLPGRKYVRFAERDGDRFVTRHRRDAIAPPRGPAAARPVVARRF
jgi:excisionase family DNA binding protein